METNGTPQERYPGGQRDPDALYQREKLVGRVKEPEIDETGKEIRFTEISKSDDLMLPDEFEFRKFILVVRRIAYASKENDPTRSRTLKGVVAEIVGYREN